MGYPGSTSFLRGFRISVATLDAFLLANGVEDTYGAPPFYQDHPDKDAISRLLYSKITKAGGTADKMNFRVMIPLRESMDYSTVAYVTYAWVSIFAHREILLDEDLPSEVPKGFEELRQEILSFGDQVEDGYKIANDGKMGLFAVYTYEIRGLYSPQELQERHKLPQYCDQCDATFEDELYAFEKRQKHRMEVHGSKEGMSPLPEA